MTPQDFYRQQSAVTNPAGYADLFDDIPDDIESICRVSHNLVNHYFGDMRHKPPKERWGEVETRFVSKMLGCALAMDDAPLMEARQDEHRVVGCCRDFTALTVAIMRHKGIPARSRYGTATYFEDGYYWDHVIVEYWNGERWVGVDSQLSPDDPRDFDFDIRDVPRNRFLVGGRGWQLARGGMEPQLFGLGSMRGGYEFIVTEMLLDLAALNKEEHLCWEGWGLSNQRFKSYTDEDLALLDKVAEVTQDDTAFETWRELFTHPKLAIPDVVTSFSPSADPKQYPLSVSIR